MSASGNLRQRFVRSLYYRLGVDVEFLVDIGDLAGGAKTVEPCDEGSGRTPRRERSGRALALASISRWRRRASGRRTRLARWGENDRKRLAAYA
jgi:hypothetical protein